MNAMLSFLLLSIAVILSSSCGSNGNGELDPERRKSKKELAYELVKIGEEADGLYGSFAFTYPNYVIVPTIEKINADNMTIDLKLRSKCNSKIKAIRGKILIENIFGDDLMELRVEFTDGIDRLGTIYPSYYVGNDSRRIFDYKQQDLKISWVETHRLIFEDGTEAFHYSQNPCINYSIEGLKLANFSKDEYIEEIECAKNELEKIKSDLKKYYW